MPCISVARENAPEILVDEIVPSHGWTAVQLRQLAPGDQLEVLACYGSMSKDIKATDPHSVREIPVFRRR